MSEFESNIIGLVITGNLDPATTGLDTKHFVNFANKKIWSAIEFLAGQKRTPDLITTSEYLEAKKATDRLEDPSTNWLLTLGMMAKDHVGKFSAKGHIEKIKSDWKTREIKNIGAEMANDNDPDLNKYIKMLMELSSTERKYLHSFGEAAKETLNEIEKVMSGGSVTIPTGLKDIDRLTGGLHKSDLIIVAARAAMGKTAFLLNMAAANENKPLIFSIEQSRVQAIARLFSIHGKVPNHLIRTGNIGDAEFGQIAIAIEKITKSNGYIYDKSGCYMGEIEATAREVYHNQGCSAIYLDYIQRIKHENSNLPPHQAIGDIAMRLKDLARELNIPVVALAQVNRKVEERSDKRPYMADIKDSGTIEQEADSIMTLYRDEVYNDDSSDKGTCEVNFKKNRHGGTGMVKIKWTPQTMRFDDLAKTGYENYYR